MLEQELLGLPARGVASEVESQLPGFKPCFGGEELHRALAALTGDVVGGTIKLDFGDGITPSTAQLSTLSLSRQTSANNRHHQQGSKHDLPSLQLKDLHAAAKLYDAAAAQLGTSAGVYDLHYSHGLVLQELASKTDPSGTEHRQYLEQACAAYEAAAAVRPNASAALYNWGVALSDLARVLKAAASTAAQHQLQQQQQQQAPGVTPSKGTTAGGAAAQQPSVHGKAAGQGQGAGPGAAGATPGSADSKGQDAGGTGEKAPGSYLAAARRCLALASEKYREALTYQPCNPQALNNWGLVLQEVSAEAESMAERDRLVRFALEKFRCAVRMRPDFDRGCYNLGTVCYSYACTLQSELASQYRGIQVSSLDAEGQRLWQAREAEVRTAFATAAQYICLAYALAPGRDVYRRSRALVRSMLPLPFLRAGFLLAPIPTPPTLAAPAPVNSHHSSQASGPSASAPPTAAPSSSTLEDVWRRDWFVLDHLSLRAVSGLESALSATAATAAAPTGSPTAYPATISAPGGVAGSAVVMADHAGGAPGYAGPGLVRGASGDVPTLLAVALSDVAAVRRCRDPTLPGHGVWLQLHSNPLGIYLAADGEEAADVWTDCLLLASHIAQARGEDALADALSPT